MGWLDDGSFSAGCDAWGDDCADDGAGDCAEGGLASCATEHAPAVTTSRQPARSLLAPIGSRRSVAIARAIAIQQAGQILAGVRARQLGDPMGRSEEHTSEL